MDDRAATSSLSFVVSGTLFTLALGGLTIVAHNPGHGLPSDQIADPGRALAATELLDLLVGPAGTGWVTSTNSSISPMSSSSSSSSLPFLTTPSSTMSNTSSSSTSSHTNNGNGGQGCVNGKSQASGCVSDASSSLTSSTTNTQTNPFNNAPCSSTSGTPSFNAARYIVQQTSATPGYWNSTTPGFRLALGLLPGVLDPYKLATLNNTVSDNATDGLFNYNETRQLFGMSSNQGFCLLITHLDGTHTVVDLDFGKAVPVNVPSAAAYGRFCIATCDPAVGGRVVDVSLFVFL